MITKRAVRKHRYRARANGTAQVPYDFDAVCDGYRNDGGNVTCGTCGAVIWPYRRRKSKRFSDRKLTVGHIVPISRGGPDVVFNVFPQCLKCNRIQADRILFVEQQPARPHPILKAWRDVLAILQNPKPRREKPCE